MHLSCTRHLSSRAYLSVLQFRLVLQPPRCSGVPTRTAFTEWKTQLRGTGARPESVLCDYVLYSSARNSMYTRSVSPSKRCVNTLWEKLTRALCWLIWKTTRYDCSACWRGNKSQKRSIKWSVWRGQSCLFTHRTHRITSDIFNLHKWSNKGVNTSQQTHPFLVNLFQKAVRF